MVTNSVLAWSCAACFFAGVAVFLLLIALLSANENDKKKIKTSEIRMRVEFTDPDNPTHARLIRVYRKESLMHCVQAALNTAKQLELKINSMELLTTED
jgi:hypothetical protein